MSEYTDYLIYRTEAATYEALRAEVAEVAGAGTVIYTSDDFAAATTQGPLPSGGQPAWVALVADKSLAEIATAAKGPVARVLVLEDFASWQFTAECPGAKPVNLYFGGEDGYADGWFGYNDVTYTGLTASVPEATLTALSECLGMPKGSLSKGLRYDAVWTFLTDLGAPSIQMLDQGLAQPVISETGGATKFAQEVWPESFE
jgi:hypothetical protein